MRSLIIAARCSAAYICRHAVSVRPSRSCIQSKRLNIIFESVSPWIATPFQLFHTKRFGIIFRRVLPLTGKNRDFRAIFGSGDWHRSLLDRRLSSTFRWWSIGYSTYASSVSRDQQTPPRHASVNLAYMTGSFDVTRKTTEHNLIVRNYT